MNDSEPDALMRRSSPLATLFAILFAVVAIHGLASHDLPHGSMVPQAISAGIADFEHNHGGTLEPDHGTTPYREGGHPDGGMHLAAVCLVVFLGFGLRKRVGPWRRLITSWGRAISIFSRGRPAEAPCLHQLSILRC